MTMNINPAGANFDRKAKPVAPAKNQSLNLTTSLAADTVNFSFKQSPAKQQIGFKGFFNLFGNGGGPKEEMTPEAKTDELIDKMQNPKDPKTGEINLDDSQRLLSKIKAGKYDDVLEEPKLVQRLKKTAEDQVSQDKGTNVMVSAVNELLKRRTA